MTRSLPDPLRISLCRWTRSAVHERDHAACRSNVLHTTVLLARSHSAIVALASLHLDTVQLDGSLMIGSRRGFGLVLWISISSCSYPELSRLATDAAGIDAVSSDAPQMSCAGLASTCGANTSTSCCRVELVSGSTGSDVFFRSYDEATDDYNDRVYSATVSSFGLDVFEVTVGRFRAFVEAGRGTALSPPDVRAGEHPMLANSGWDSSWNSALVTDAAALATAVKCDAIDQTWTDAPGANENKPINCVTWYEAMAFCIWDGGYLPTEAEWNYAASGGAKHRAYPWSNPSSNTNVDCTRANLYSCANGADRVGLRPLGDGLWHHSDLAGNVWEWTLDWFGVSYPFPCENCANLSESSERVHRGGSFVTGPTSLRVADRFHFPPASRDKALGFRCARGQL